VNLQQRMQDCDANVLSLKQNIQDLEMQITASAPPQGDGGQGAEGAEVECPQMTKQVRLVGVSG